MWPVPLLVQREVAATFLKHPKGSGLQLFYCLRNDGSIFPGHLQIFLLGKSRLVPYPGCRSSPTGYDVVIVTNCFHIPMSIRISSLVSRDEILHAFGSGLAGNWGSWYSCFDANNSSAIFSFRWLHISSKKRRATFLFWSFARVLFIKLMNVRSNQYGNFPVDYNC